MELVVRPDDVNVAARPEQVWDVLADFDAHGEWSPGFQLRGASAEAGAWVLVVARLVPGPPALIPAQIRRSVRGRVLSWGGALPGVMQLEHSFELEPVATGTRVVHQERFSGISALAVRPLAARMEREYGLMSARLRARAEAMAA